MANKKISKASKRRLMIFGTLSLIIMSYALLNLVTYSYRMKKLSDQQAILTEQLKELKDKESDLKSEINKLKDPDYLARYARENYLYTKDGEYVIKVDEKKNKERKKEKEIIPLEYKYYMFAGLSILLFTIFYILRTLKKDRTQKKKKKGKKK